MKNLKYSSVVSTFAGMILSVFLFTGCEKDTAVGPHSSKGDIIDKFKRLKFQTVTTTKDNASGSFVGTGDNDANFVEPNTQASNNFASNTGTGANNSFTNPTASTNSFTVNGSFGFGGGSFNFNGNSHNLAFGFCGFDLFGELGEMEGELDNVDIFIGVAGDFNIEEMENEGDTTSSDSTSSGELDYIIYAVSYNGGTELSNFAEVMDEENPNLEDLAFVMLIEFEDGNGDLFAAKGYLSTSGSISYSDDYMTLSSVSMVDEEGNSAGNLNATFECVNAEDFVDADEE